jgi:hypothetical protein
MVRTMSEDFTVPEEPATDPVVGAAAEKDLYTVMVAYEGTKHVYTKEGAPFDAFDVKVRLYLNIFKDLGMQATRVKKDIQLRHCDVWVTDNGRLFTDRMTFVEAFVNNPTGAAASSSGAAVAPILRPRGGGLTVDLSAAEVVEIESILEKVVFDDKKYKREAIKNGASVFVGAVRGGVATSTYDNVEVAAALNGVMRKYCDAVGMPHWTSICINLNTVADWHVDKGNVGDSVIMIFGNFERGGNLVVMEGQAPQTLSVHNKLLVFDGKQKHMSEPFFGSEPFVWRASVIFYTTQWHTVVKGDKRSFLEEKCSFVFPKGAVATMSQWERALLSLGASVAASSSGAAATEEEPDAVESADDDSESSFKIFVKFDYMTCIFNVFPDDHIANLKGQIQHLWGIPPKMQLLTYADETLINDMMTLSDYNIQMNGTVLPTVFVAMKAQEDDNSKSSFPIFMKPFHYHTCVLKVFPDDIVANLKGQIQRLIGTPPKTQTLTYAGKPMINDMKTLSEYNIQQDGKVDLAMKALGGGKRARAAEGTAGGGITELRNTFGRGMKMIDDNRVSDAANETFHAMSRLSMLLARNKTTPVHEVLNGLSIEQVAAIQTAIASHTTPSTRHKAIARSVLQVQFDAVEHARSQLKDCEQVLNDGLVLLLNSQYGLSGSMGWDIFSKDLTTAISNKSAAAGAAAVHRAAAGGVLG